MSTNPMQSMGDQGDPGDENDSSLQQCEQEIEDLEARVSTIEQKLGIQSPADEPEPAAMAMPTKKKGPLTGKAPFFGSY
jgi:hypothetical protein